MGMFQWCQADFFEVIYLATHCRLFENYRYQVKLRNLMASDVRVSIIDCILFKWQTKQKTKN